MADENSIDVEPYSAEGFLQLLRNAGAAINGQARYLAGYLDKLGAKTVVSESRYIDRHFMDEFALFYSRMLRPPPNTVRRLHFFEKPFDDLSLRRWMAEGFRGRNVEHSLRKECGRYLGYLCLRPISDSPIGRTVVARWPDGSKSRDIWAVGDYPVHLGNLGFEVRGLPFQQQDTAVGACATTSIWTALSRVARHEGMRAPTPAEIAEAVERPIRPFVRGPFSPTTGFTPEQVCTAIQLFGFTPAVVTGERPELLALALHTYLQSGIPVVMVLRGGDVGHAVTVAGFQLSGSERADLETWVATRSMQLSKVYVHDDRIGPYARATLTPFFIRDVADVPDASGMRFQIEADGHTENWTVTLVVAPVYPKIRLSIQALLDLAERMQPLIERAAGDDAFALRVDLRYARSGEYLASLKKRIHPTRGAAMASKVVLPRWCAVIRWSVADAPLVELVYDTTHFTRGQGAERPPAPVAVIALHKRFRSAAKVIAEELRIPYA